MSGRDKSLCELNPTPRYFVEFLRSTWVWGKFGLMTYEHFRSVSHGLIYFLGTFSQSLRNLSIPISVRGCVISCSITLKGIVATSAPTRAASTT